MRNSVLLNLRQKVRKFLGEVDSFSLWPQSDDGFFCLLVPPGICKWFTNHPKIELEGTEEEIMTGLRKSFGI